MKLKHTILIRHNTLRSMLGLLMLATMVVASSMLSSCHKRLSMTILEVEDSVRHYSSVVLGDELSVVYVLRNTGDEMLVLTDVQPACPTIEPAKGNVTTIPPGKEAPLKFVYHADKNIGLARHSIRLYGNIAPKGVAELIFDTHVVRPSVDLSDYEEFHQKELQSLGENIIEGHYGEKNYYVGDEN